MESRIVELQRSAAKRAHSRRSISVRSNPGPPIKIKNQEPIAKVGRCGQRTCKLNQMLQNLVGRVPPRGAGRDFCNRLSIFDLRRGFGEWSLDG